MLLGLVIPNSIKGWVQRRRKKIVKLIIASMSKIQETSLSNNLTTRGLITMGQGVT